MEESKELLDLLKQIEKHNRRQALFTAALCVCALITLACCVVTFVTAGQILPQITEVLPQITGVLPQINSVVAQMQTVLRNLEQTTSQLAQLDLGSMVTDISTLVTTGQESLEETMTKLDSIDFNALNKAIQDLSAVIEPLAKISTLFK